MILKEASFCHQLLCDADNILSIALRKNGAHFLNVLAGVPVTRILPSAIRLGATVHNDILVLMPLFSDVNTRIDLCQESSSFFKFKSGIFLLMLGVKTGRMTSPTCQLNKWITMSRISRSTGAIFAKRQNARLEVLTGIRYPTWRTRFFGSVPGLTAAAAEIFQHCTINDKPLLQDGWAGWPANCEPKKFPITAAS